MTRLKPQALTAEAFAPYGDVIEVANAKEIRQINYGNTRRFHDLAGRRERSERGVFPGGTGGA